MASTNFGFPHSSPYSVQIELMTDVYNAIENRNIAFFESPTGTVLTIKSKLIKFSRAKL
jgi:Rad3-related DNA helicase